MPWHVGDVMTREVVRVRPDTDFKACVDLLRIHGISALPVVDEREHVLGIVSEFDLLLKEAGRDEHPGHGHNWRHERARVAADMMSVPAVCTASWASIPEAARLMESRRLKRLPVVDPFGRLVGIVSRFDLLKPFLRSDESIRGEVTSELAALAIDPAAVTVDVNDGVVQLDGAVESKSLKELIGRLLGRIEGVVGVENHLRYRFDDQRLKTQLPDLALQLAASERDKS
jgi:CBS domain-containing protein